MTTLRFDLKSQITWASAVAAFRALFDWWLEKIAEMLSRAWHERLSRAFGRWTVHMESQVWRICGPGEMHETLVLGPAAQEDEMRQRIERSDATMLARRVIAIVPQQHALVRRIKLPAAIGLRLRSAVGLQLDRLSPFRPAEVRFDCRQTVPAVDGEIGVEVAIVAKRNLDDFERRLERLGISVFEFRLEGLPFRFKPSAGHRTTQERLQLALAAFVAVALAATALLTPATRVIEEQSLLADIAQLRPAARAAAAARADMQRAQMPFAISSSALARPDALDVLRLITELMPADVQLSELSIGANDVRLVGTCGDAHRLVALLKRSRHFARVLLDAPTGPAGSGRERFEIALSMEAAP